MILLIGIQKSPFDILGDSGGNHVETNIGVQGTNQFSLADIGIVLQQFILFAGVVTTIASLVILLFIRNNTKLLAEKKQGIIHKLFIIWLSASAVTLFNILKSFLDGIFGF